MFALLLLTATAANAQSGVSFAAERLAAFHWMVQNCAARQHSPELTFSIHTAEQVTSLAEFRVASAAFEAARSERHGRDIGASCSELYGRFGI